MRRHPPLQPPVRPASLPRRAWRRIGQLKRLLAADVASGLVLLAAAAIALVWANSPVAASYHALWELRIGVSAGGYEIAQSLRFLVNEVLMVVFFLAVGMEVRREMHDGALAHGRQAALPVVAALGGVAVPALIYLAFNREPLARAGWAVPTATDIAFAVGVLMLLGRAVPAGARALLLTLAVVDDIVAILIIAVFYSHGLDYTGLLIAGNGIALVWVMQRLGAQSAVLYVLPGAVVWGGMLMAGLHPTLAGVVLGLLTPVRVSPEPVGVHGYIPPATRVATVLRPWVSFLVMPLFALCNAGVTLGGLDLSAAGAGGVAFGVFAALVVGKPLGVLAASLLGVRAGGCRLPADVDWRGMVLVGVLAGVGFTMSLFIAMLAFGDARLLAAAKLGVLSASVVAAVAGLAWGRVMMKRRPRLCGSL